MEKKRDESKVFPVHCPVCHSTLWIDPWSQEVLQYEKAEKKKGSLDELLAKEKKRKKEFERKFEATAELGEEKKKEVHKKFKKYFTEVDKEK